MSAGDRPLSHMASHTAHADTVQTDAAQTNAVQTNAVQTDLGDRSSQTSPAWLAERYVLGELTADETCAFEELLAAELAAGDLTHTAAIIEAERLVTSIAAALSSQAAQPHHAAQSTSTGTVPARKSRWRPRSLMPAALVLSAAAVLLLTVGLFMEQRGTEQPAGTLVAQADGDALIAHWLGVQPTDAWGHEAWRRDLTQRGWNLTDRARDRTPQGDDAAATVDDLLTEEGQLPNWLLAAVSLEMGLATDSDDEFWDGQ